MLILPILVDKVDMDVWRGWTWQEIIVRLPCEYRQMRMTCEHVVISFQLSACVG